MNCRNSLIDARVTDVGAGPPILPTCGTFPATTLSMTIGALPIEPFVDKTLLGSCKCDLEKSEVQDGFMSGSLLV